MNSVKGNNTTKEKKSFRAPATLRRVTASFFRTPSPVNSSNEEVQASPLWEAFERRNLPLVKKLAANLGYTNKITLAVRNAAENIHETLVTDLMADSHVGKPIHHLQNEEKLLEKIVIALGGTIESSGGRRLRKHKRKTYRKRR